MKIEPCPFCGVDLVRLHYNQADGWPEWVECANCHAEGDKRTFKQDAIDSWNRLSRIVRAAEEYVMAREAIPGEVFAEFGDDSVSFPAYEELKAAVEGGNANAEGD